MYSIVDALRIFEAPELVHLDVSNNKLTDEEFEALLGSGRLPKLQFADVSGNMVRRGLGFLIQTA